MLKATSALVLTLLVVPTAARAEKAAGKHPDLTGSWTLNEAMSENAQDKMRDLRSQRRAGRGGFGGPPPGTGRGGGVGGGGWSTGGRGRSRGEPGDGPADSDRDPAGPMATIDQGVDAIEIAQTEDQVAITYADDRLRILFADGRKDERTGPMGAVVTTAKWNKDGELTVRSKTESGKITEVYKLDRDGARLLVDLTIDGPMGEITFFRTYDREMAADGT